jgi:hypothetical protein
VGAQEHGKKVLATLQMLEAKGLSAAAQLRGLLRERDDLAAAEKLAAAEVRASHCPPLLLHVLPLLPFPPPLARGIPCCCSIACPRRLHRPHCTVWHGCRPRS